MRSTRTLLALGLTAALLTACSGAGTDGSAAPSAAPPASGASVAPPASEGAPAFDPTTVEGDLVLQGWSAGAVEAPILDQLLVQFQEKYPNIKVDLPAGRGRLPGVDGRQVQLGRRPGRVLRRLVASRRPGSTTAVSSHSTRTSRSVATTSASSSTATSTRSRAPTARSTASPRTATRWRWPTTPRCSPPPASRPRPRRGPS